MDILHGSSPLPIQLNPSISETVRLRGIEPLDSRSATPPAKSKIMAGVLRSFLIVMSHPPEIFNCY
jgi:hypothetical protein